MLPPIDIPTIEPLYPTIHVKMKTAQSTASESTASPQPQEIPAQEIQEALAVYEQTQPKG